MNKKKTGARREYGKPRMQAIDLLADEVMTAGCKTAAGAGDPYDNFGPGCIINNCQTDIGS